MAPSGGELDGNAFELDLVAAKGNIARGRRSWGANQRPPTHVPLLPWRSLFVSLAWLQH